MLHEELVQSSIRITLNDGLPEQEKEKGGIEA